MDLVKFVSILDKKEKVELFQILFNEVVENPQKNGFTPIELFCRNVEMSTRLRNVLLANKEALGDYIEIVDASIIHKLRNASIKTQEEFVNVRGF